MAEAKIERLSRVFTKSLSIVRHVGPLRRAIGRLFLNRGVIADQQTKLALLFCLERRLGMIREGNSAMLTTLASTTTPSIQLAPPCAVHRIVAVDDDAFFRATLTNELAEHGYSVDAFPDAHSFLQALPGIEDADAILLDWTLEESCGLDLVPQIRQRGIHFPIIFLTGRSFASDELKAFESGATDFIDKARGIAVLLCRLRKIAQPTGKVSIVARQLEVGDLMLKLHVSRAYWQGRDLGLTLGEYKILELLVSNAGCHVTYRDIYDQLHYRGFHAGSGSLGYRTNVRSAIKRLRSKLRAFQPNFDRIENYAAFGYVWRADSFS